MLYARFLCDGTRREIMGLFIVIRSGFIKGYYWDWSGNRIDVYIQNIIDWGVVRLRNI